MNDPSLRSAVLGSHIGHKRRAIVEAAADLFLQHGYLGASMDAVAAQARVSKPTVYKYFPNKEALFVAVVEELTGTATDEVQREISGLGERDDVEDVLLAFAERQIRVVLTQRLMQLRRLVIGEANRFPQLGKSLYDEGPSRAVAGLASVFARWRTRGLLAIDDHEMAASHFNWLLMGDLINRAMLLGEMSIPAEPALRRHATHAVRVFLAAYGGASLRAYRGP